MSEMPPRNGRGEWADVRDGKSASGITSDAANQTMGLADMGILDDILSALDRIPVWKRLQELPAKIDVPKAQVAVLEEKLGAKWPADIMFAP